MDPERLSDLESDLRAVSDDIAADAERVQRIERTKGRLDVDDPRLPALAEESAAIAEAMAEKTKAEAALVDEIGAEPDAA